MRPFQHLKLFLSFIIANLFFTHTYSYAQDSTLQKSILVYILPDSLELPALQKVNVSYTKAIVKSTSLLKILNILKPAALGKAFPNWNGGDSIKTNDLGIKIKAPEFDRVFTFTFQNAQQAESAISLLKKQPSVLYAEKNMSPRPYQDPRFDDGTQWHLQNDGRLGGVVGADIHAVGAWNIFTGSAAVTIAVVDDGVDINHEELTGKATGDQPPAGNNHGTHVAGIAAARAGNGHGGRGVDWNAQILSKQIFNAGDQYISDANTATKINEAVNAGAQILNYSWGGGTYSTTIAQAVAYTYKMNRVTVAAMSEGNEPAIVYPAALNNVITVAATQNNDQRSPFSHAGNYIDVAAPGGVGFTDGRDIYSDAPNNGYQFLAGISMSAPEVSGLASLLKGYNTNLANDDIDNIIKLSADKVGILGYTNGFNTELGFGRINAQRALTIVSAPNQISQLSTTGGTVANTSASYVIQIIGAPNLASGNYTVKRSEVRTNIVFPNTFCSVQSAWGRGVGSKGWGLSSPNFGEGFCEVVPGTLTANGATLRTYIYEMWSMSGQYLGFYPASVANAVFQYTILGTPRPSTISGDNAVCTTSNNYTIPNLPTGAAVTWSTSPAGIATLNSPNSLQTTLTKNNNGFITLTATTNACGNLTLTKPLAIGTPSNNNIFAQQISGTCYYDLATNAPPAGTGTIIEFSEDNINWSGGPASGSTVTAGYFLLGPTYQKQYVRTRNACGVGPVYYKNVYIPAPPPRCQYRPITKNANKPEETQLSTIARVYPNPVSKKLLIEIPSTKNASVTIYNNEGKLVYNGRLSNTKNSINFSSYTAGLYLIKVMVNDQVKTVKIIKD